MKKSSILGLTLLTAILQTAAAELPSVSMPSGRFNRATLTAIPAEKNVNHNAEEVGRLIHSVPTKGFESRELKTFDLHSAIPTSARQNAPGRGSLSGASLYTWMGPTDTEPGGWYAFDTNGNYSLQWTNVLSDIGINLTNGWMRNGRLCGLGVFNMGGMIVYYNYLEIDPKTGTLLEEISVGPDNTIDMTSYYMSCAYVASEDKIYGYTYGEDERSFRFCSSPADNIGDVTVIKPLTDSSERLNAMCWNPEENAFFGVTFNDEFVKVGLDGEVTSILKLPIDNVKNDKTALVYSPYDGCYIYTPLYYTYATQLYYIYPEEKQVRFVKNYSDANQFFFFINDNYTYDPAAPARPVLVKDNLQPGALEGEWIVRMPSKTAGGEVLSGELTWNLYVDNVKTTSGVGAPGEEVNVKFGPLEQGEHVVRISCSDAAGKEGVPFAIDRYFGNGIPLPPEDVTLTDGKVAWSPVTEALLGGYLEPGKMRYDVYINNKFVGSTTETSMEITIEADKEVAAYYAYVAANCNGQISERTKSNKLIFGKPFQLPYTVVPTEAQADLTWTFNEDGSPAYGTWEFWAMRWHEPVFASGWSNEKADDWLILPPVDCSDLSHAYRVTLDAVCGGTTGKDERFEVWCGNAPTPEAMNTLIIPETQVTEFITSGWETFTNKFVPKQAGPCYIAIRAVSPPGQYSLIVRKIIIEATDEAADVPNAPSDFTVIGKDDAALTADVSFTVPATTIAGSAIEETDDLKVMVGLRDKWTEKSVKPGEKVTMTVATYQGDNRLSAYCLLNGQAGQESTANIFTGTIPPNFVMNFHKEVSRDNMSVKLTWEPPVRGQENLEGYYSPEGMHYWLVEVVQDPEYGDYSWVPTKNLGNVTEYTYSLPEGASLGVRYLGISAANNGGVSDAISYTYPQIGTPYRAEVVEDFDGGSVPELHYTPLSMPSLGEEYNSEWEFVAPEELGAAIWNPSVPYAIINFASSNEGPTKGYLELPKFSSENLKSPGLTLTLWTSEPCTGTVSVEATTYGKPWSLIYEVPFLNKGWQDVEIPLPAEFCDMPWIQLALDTYLPGYYSYVLLGGYKFGEVTGNGVHGVDMTTKSFIFGGRGEIVVLGHAGEEVGIYALDGKLISSSVADGEEFRVKASAGIYTVVCGGKASKVMVK